MFKLLGMLSVSAVLAAAPPMKARAAEWHMVPDEVSAGVPLKVGFVIGAVSEESVKRNSGYVEATVSMFYPYELIQAALNAEGSNDTNFQDKFSAAMRKGRANSYIGVEQSFIYNGGTQYFTDMNTASIRSVLISEEILVGDGYSPISTRTIQIKCKSRVDFEYRYVGDNNWNIVHYPSDGSGPRGDLLPFVCDKIGVGQSGYTTAPSARTTDRSAGISVPPGAARETIASDRAWQVEDQKGPCSRLRNRLTDAPADVVACDRHTSAMPRCWNYRGMAWAWLHMRENDQRTFSLAPQILSSFGTGRDPYVIDRDPGYLQQLRRLLDVISMLDLSQRKSTDAFAAVAYKRCLSGAPF